MLEGSQISTDGAVGSKLTGKDRVPLGFVPCDVTFSVSSFDNSAGTITLKVTDAKETRCSAFSEDLDDAKINDTVTFDKVETSSGSITKMGPFSWESQQEAYVKTYKKLELDQDDITNGDTPKLTIQEKGTVECTMDLKATDNSLTMDITSISDAGSNAPTWCKDLTDSDTLNGNKQKSCGRFFPMGILTLKDSGNKVNTEYLFETCEVFGLQFLYNVNGFDGNLLEEMPMPQLHVYSSQNINFEGDLFNSGSALAKHLKENVFGVSDNKPSFAAIWPENASQISLSTLPWSGAQADTGRSNIDDESSTVATNLRSEIESSLTDDSSFGSNAVIDSLDNVERELVIAAPIFMQSQNGMHPIFKPPSEDGGTREARSSSGVDSSSDTDGEAASEDELMGSDGGGVVLGETIIELNGVTSFSFEVNRTVNDVLEHLIPQKTPDGEATLIDPWNPALAAVQVGTNSPYNVGFLVRVKAKANDTGDRTDAHALVESSFRVLDGLAEADGEALKPLFERFNAPDALINFDGITVRKIVKSETSGGGGGGDAPTSSSRKAQVLGGGTMTTTLRVVDTSVSNKGVAKEEVKKTLARPLQVKQGDIDVSLSEDGSDTIVTVTTTAKHSLQRKWSQVAIGEVGKVSNVLTSRLKAKVGSTSSSARARGKVTPASTGFKSTGSVVVQDSSSDPDSASQVTVGFLAVVMALFVLFQ